MKDTQASHNWLSLQKSLTQVEGSSRKRRHRSVSEPIASTSTAPAPDPTALSSSSTVSTSNVKPHVSSISAESHESIKALREMISGTVQLTSAQKLPGKYVALDCEMVGVGPKGKESTLARVSVINFNGAVLLDEFVRPRERVVDYRTQWSGVRASDLVHARTFGEVQKQVAGILKGRILVGHALHNDLKALLLSHPRSETRDTQQYGGKLGCGKKPALRTLVQREFGVSIQEGEHSSVTDARAAMALYRLYRHDWERSTGFSAKDDRKTGLEQEIGKQRKRAKHNEHQSGEVGEATVAHGTHSKSTVGQAQKVSYGGKTTVKKKGVSTGLSTVEHTHGERSKWWIELP